MPKTTRRYRKTAVNELKAAQDAADAAQSYVTRNPWAALAIGTVAGVALGALIASGLGKRFR